MRLPRMFRALSSTFSSTHTLFLQTCATIEQEPVSVPEKATVFVPFSVKIDKDKQLVILDEEHEASSLSRRVKSDPAHGRDSTYQHVCVSRTFLLMI